MQFIQSVDCAIKGIVTAWREESNFGLAITGVLIALIISVYLQFSPLESALFLVASGLILGAEMINTAIEDLCDKVEPKQDPIIGKIKDVMAGSTFIVFIFSFLAGVCLVFSHL